MQTDGKRWYPSNKMDKSIFANMAANSREGFKLGLVWDGDWKPKEKYGLKRDAWVSVTGKPLPLLQRNSCTSPAHSWDSPKRLYVNVFSVEHKELKVSVQLWYLIALFPLDQLSLCAEPHAVEIKLMEGWVIGVLKVEEGTRKRKKSLPSVLKNSFRNMQSCAV